MAAVCRVSRAIPWPRPSMPGALAYSAAASNTTGLADCSAAPATAPTASSPSATNPTSAPAPAPWSRGCEYAARTPGRRWVSTCCRCWTSCTGLCPSASTTRRCTAPRPCGCWRGGSSVVLVDWGASTSTPLTTRNTAAATSTPTLRWLAAVLPECQRLLPPRRMAQG